MIRKHFSLLATVLVAFALITGCKSEEKLALKFSPKKGKKFEITMETKQNIAMEQMGQKIDMVQNLLFTYNMEIKGQDEKNNTIILTTFKRIKFNSKSGVMDMDYDSDKQTSDSSIMTAIFSKIFEAMLNKTITLVVDEKGKPISLKGMSDIMQGMIDSAGISDEGNSMLEGLKAQYNDETFLKSFEGMFILVPGKDVSVGDTWDESKSIDIMNMKLKTDSKYVLKDIKDKKAIVAVDSKISTGGTTGEGTGGNAMNGTQSGTMEIDVDSGIPISANLVQDITMTTQSGGTEIPMKLKSTVVITSKELQ